MYTCTSIIVCIIYTSTCTYCMYMYIPTCTCTCMVIHSQSHIKTTYHDKCLVKNHLHRTPSQSTAYLSCTYMYHTCCRYMLYIHVHVHVYVWCIHMVHTLFYMMYCIYTCTLYICNMHRVNFINLTRLPFQL